MSSKQTINVSTACMRTIRDAMGRYLRDGVLVGPGSFMASAHKALSKSIHDAGDAPELAFTGERVNLLWLCEFAQCGAPGALQELRAAVGWNEPSKPVVNSPELREAAEEAHRLCDEMENAKPKVTPSEKTLFS